MNKLFPVRVVMPAAATSAALLSLTGCGLLNFGRVPDTSELAIPPAPLATQPTLAEQTAADVQRQVDRLNAALDHQSKTPGGKPTASALAGDPPKPAGLGTHVSESVTPPNPLVAGPATQPATTAPIAAAAVTPTDPAPAISAMASMTAVSVTPNAMDSALPANPIAPEPAMDSLLDTLRKRVAAHPNQINYALALELLETAETGKATDPATLSGLPQIDQQLLTDLIPALQSLAAQPASAATTLADRAAPLTSAARKWESEGDLSLPRIALASRVDSYGVYTPVEAKFEYGKRNVVIIYCEVANFTSKKLDEPGAAADGGVYQTRLAQQDTLITDDGLLVWRPNPEEVEDRSRNRRHDFYLVKKLTIPENLAIGKYTLRMSVTDKLSNKICMATLPIEIVGK